MRRRLVVMARAPRAGAVKSRLARDVGAVEAVRFSRVVLARLVRRLGADPRWGLCLAVTPDALARSPVWPAGPARRPQGRGDLGARMQRLMDRMPPGPVVLVGSDVPDIARADVAAAFAALGSCDAVFGPAPDGGFWLVGLARRRGVPRLFAGVRWSGEHALADTLANCRGLRVGFVATREDVDTAPAWRRWRRATG